MKKSNPKKILSEEDIDRWIDQVDLSRTGQKFKPVSFPNPKKDRLGKVLRTAAKDTTGKFTFTSVFYSSN